MHTKNHLPLSTLTLAILSALAANVSSAGSNFTITPTSGMLKPIMVFPGDTVSAFYTVTNETRNTLSGYRLQGLPSTVSQNTLNPSYCQNPLKLASHASCILQLDISGTAQSNFALCKGESCTTTANPLAVKEKAHRATVGTYLNINDGTAPLSYTSDNGGFSWELSPSLPLPYDIPAIPSRQFTQLMGISCNTNGTGICVAVGFYQNNTPNESGVGSQGPVPSFSESISPLIYTSRDGGESWSLSTPLPLPSDAATGNNQDIELNSVTCSPSNRCVAVGFYSAVLSPSPLSTEVFPFSYTSTDGGETWALSNPLARALPDGNYIYNAMLNSVSCDSTGLNCATVGNYQVTSDPDSNTVPLGYTTTDGGQTWTITNSFPAPINQPSTHINNTLYGITCDNTGQFCNAVGANKNDLLPPSFVPSNYYSTDFGNTWTNSTLPLPNDVATSNAFTQLNSISCDKNTHQSCITVGYYLNYQKLSLPLSYFSTDGGQSWTVNPTHLPLPSDISTNPSLETQRVGLNSITCNTSNTLCTAVGSYWNTQGLNVPLSYTYSINALPQWTVSETLPLPSDVSTNPDIAETVLNSTN